MIEGTSSVSITLIVRDGAKQVLKAKTEVNSSEIIDAAVMSKKALSSFSAQEISHAKRQDVLLSLHLKATMMKVSDPIMFGIVVSEFYKDVLARYNDKLKTLCSDANNGIGDLHAKIKDLPTEDQAGITQAIDALYTERPPLAIMNSDKGITNLHVPSDVIVEASMPAMIRDSGKMWGS